MKGTKHDQDKPDYSLVPSHGEEEFVKVLTFGANKYSRENWKQVPNLQDRYYSALRRHIQSYRNGETTDPESGYHHLAHAMCCLAFMMEDDMNKDSESK